VRKKRNNEYLYNWSLSIWVITRGLVITRRLVITGRSVTWGSVTRRLVITGRSISRRSITGRSITGRSVNRRFVVNRWSITAVRGHGLVVWRRLVVVLIRRLRSLVRSSVSVPRVIGFARIWLLIIIVVLITIGWNLAPSPLRAG
jgi:hypothetical protein